MQSAMKDRERNSGAVLPLGRQMVSLPNNLPAQYRARAEEARVKAEAASDPEVRKSLLRDAELWERMAQYEELVKQQSEAGYAAQPKPSSD
jgi:hypothetical protein